VDWRLDWRPGCGDRRLELGRDRLAHSSFFFFLYILLQKAVRGPLAGGGFNASKEIGILAPMSSKQLPWACTRSEEKMANDFWTW